MQRCGGAAAAAAAWRGVAAADAPTHRTIAGPLLVCGVAPRAGGGGAGAAGARDESQQRQPRDDAGGGPHAGACGGAGTVCGVAHLPRCCRVCGGPPGSAAPQQQGRAELPRLPCAAAPLPQQVPVDLSSHWQPVRAEGLPAVFTGGWVGYTGYDTVRYVYSGARCCGPAGAASEAAAGQPQPWPTRRHHRLPPPPPCRRQAAV